MLLRILLLIILLLTLPDAYIYIMYIKRWTSHLWLRLTWFIPSIALATAAAIIISSNDMTPQHQPWVSIFMLIFLMDGSKMEIGAALGLFAVFGIIRYRTESVPIREMTYLFFLVALSVLNGTTASLSFVEHIVANLILLAVVWLCESYLLRKKEGCKFVKYDNIDLISPDKYEELKADLEKRLGVKVNRVEVGAVDFLVDMAMLRVYYDDPDAQIKSVDRVLKIPQDNVF